MKITLTLLSLVILAGCASSDNLVSDNPDPVVLGHGVQSPEIVEAQKIMEDIEPSPVIISGDAGTNADGELLPVTAIPKLKASPARFPECMNESFEEYEARLTNASGHFDSHSAKCLQILEEMNELSTQLGDLDNQLFEIAPEGSAAMPLDVYNRYGSLMAYHMDASTRMSELDKELEKLSVQIGYVANENETTSSSPYLQVTNENIAFKTFGVYDCKVEFPTGSASKNEIHLAPECINAMKTLMEMQDELRKNPELSSRYDFEILYSFYGYVDFQEVSNQETISMLAKAFNDPSLLTASSDYLNQKLSELRARVTEEFIGAKLDEMGLVNDHQESACHTQGKQFELPYEYLENPGSIENQERRICKVMCMIVAQPKGEEFAKNE